MAETTKVFVSSTYIDNIERRTVVEQAVLRADMIPVGMERFTAKTKLTVDECIDQAKSCDLLVGIIAHRYGWIPEGHDCSITELEYDAQPERLMFLIDDRIKPELAQLDEGGDLSHPDFPVKVAKLREFKERIRREQTAKNFDDHDLELLVYHALMEWQKQNKPNGKTTLPGPNVTPDTIQLPTRFAERINNNGKYKSDVDSLLKTLQDTTPSHSAFFPELEPLQSFVNRRLYALDAMIPDESLGVMSNEDLVALIGVVSLYAKALFVTPEKLCRLAIDSQSSVASAAWIDAWENFLSEARRYDGRQLRRLFGETSPIEVPSENFQQWSESDVVLISEFLRQRIADIIQEFALPGSQLLEDDWRDQIDADLLETAVIVASCIDVGVRAAIDKSVALSSKPEIRELRFVHIPYLMAIFRLSLFLNVAEARAANANPKISSIVASLDNDQDYESLALRDLVMDISFSHDDPEAIYISTTPSSSRAYTAIRKLIDQFQSELDKSWAVLGEVYGRLEGYNQFCFSVRRIRSSLDNLDAFKQRVDYVPNEVRFDSAGVDLLKLLIGPLYGNRPQVGIRELIQNSVDAVRERQYRENTDDLSGETGDADVTVELNVEADNLATLIIRDRGVGMTPDIVQNYFMRAGASYRRSDAWRDQYEEEEGKSNVVRSGRFGVGVLAAFLLGQQISVVTRHFRSPPDQGVAFSGTIEDDLVELRYVNAEIGTTVEIKLTDEKLIKAIQPVNTTSSNIMRRWDWFCLKNPLVQRKINGDTLPQKYVLPVANEILPEGWHRIKGNVFQDVHWSFSIPHGLYCNGIPISDDPSEPTRHFQNPPLHVLRSRCPAVSVFDPDGHLALNLQRNALSRQGLPFLQRVNKSFYISIIESLVKFCVEFGSINNGGFFLKLRNLSSLAFRWLLDQEANRIPDSSLPGRGLGCLSACR
ncbi:MAG: DUF4062 domain-containing protein [Planctomycetota bacterium]